MSILTTKSRQSIQKLGKVEADFVTIEGDRNTLLRAAGEQLHADGIRMFDISAKAESSELRKEVIATLTESAMPKKEWAAYVAYCNLSVAERPKKSAEMMFKLLNGKAISHREVANRFGGTIIGRLEAQLEKLEFIAEHGEEAAKAKAKKDDHMRFVERIVSANKALCKEGATGFEDYDVAAIKAKIDEIFELLA